MKTHKLIIRKTDVQYIDHEFASNIFSLLGGGGESITLRNDKTLYFRKLYKREIEVIPLNEIDLVVENIQNEQVKAETKTFIEQRKEKKLFVSGALVKEHIKKIGL